MTRVFTNMIVSDSDHEQVYAEIYYGKELIAVVSQEQGLDKLEIEWPSQKKKAGNFASRVPVEGFVNAITEAGLRLHGELDEHLNS